MDGYCNVKVIRMLLACLYYINLTDAVLNVKGDFFCGENAKIECESTTYNGFMTWEMDGVSVAECAVGICGPLPALPADHVFSYDQANKLFELTINSVSYAANNGTVYKCISGTEEKQITADVKGRPKEADTSLNEANSEITVNSNCVYPPGDVSVIWYCVADGTKTVVQQKKQMTPDGMACTTGDCAGSGVQGVSGSINATGDNGNSFYQAELFLNGYEDRSILFNSTAKYNCDATTTSTSSSPITTNNSSSTNTYDNTTTTPTTTTTTTIGQTSTTTTTDQTANTTTTDQTSTTIPADQTSTTDQTSKTTTTDQTSTTNSKGPNDTNLAASIIALVVVGGVIFVLAVSVVAAVICRRFKRDIICGDDSESDDASVNRHRQHSNEAKSTSVVYPGNIRPYFTHPGYYSHPLRPMNVTYVDAGNRYDSYSYPRQSSHVYDRSAAYEGSKGPKVKYPRHSYRDNTAYTTYPYRM